MSDQNEHQADPAAEAPDTKKPVAEIKTENMSEDDLISVLSAQADEILNKDAAVNEAEDLVDGSEPIGDDEGFASPLEALAAENDRLEADAQEANDKMLRMAAEMENLRRRNQKDLADARSFSISGFARDMLSVADNLRRALEHVDEGEKEQPGVKTLVEGVEMTERELLNGLEKNGVKKISPKGEIFDPNFHQAMFELENTEVPNKTVMEVVQVGYVIGERVLRPAMVGITKGGPKATKV